MKLLYVECSFALSGCNKEIKHEQRHDHESKCIYRNLPCMLSIMSSRFEDCNWDGPLNEVISHVKTSHNGCPHIAFKGDSFLFFY